MPSNDSSASSSFHWVTWLVLCVILFVAILAFGKKIRDFYVNEDSEMVDFESFERFETRNKDSNISFSSLVEILRDGDGVFYPLPVEGSPLPGRPDVAMPISTEIYGDVELLVNGKLMDHSAQQFSAGSDLRISGTIFRAERLRPDVIMDGGIALVSRAKNERGWVLRWIEFFESHMSAGQCTFQGSYKIPDAPGEYLLVVVSTAHYFGQDHYSLLAAEYPIVIE